jgi:hypothetical protein
MIDFPAVLSVNGEDSISSLHLAARGSGSTVHQHTHARVLTFGVGRNGKAKSRSTAMDDHLSLDPDFSCQHFYVPFI